MGATTFLFTDIEGSTRLWEAHPEAMREALATHDELTAKHVEANGGHVFKHMGDGAIAAFPSASPAIDAATALQAALADRLHPDVGPLKVRMGVHAGEVEQRGDDYFGPTLNRAARLMAAGHGGQILISLVAARLAGDRPDLHDLGEHRLRDLSAPERIFQVGDGDFPPLRTLDATMHNLPLMATSFIGRDEEVDDLVAAIHDGRLVTVTGVGGAGKTRLALEAAARLAGDHPGGVWFAELAAITDPAKVDRTVALALGVSNSDAGPREAVTTYLSGRPALVVIDNCEHVIDATADLVEAIVRATAEATIVATSRELLGVRGEVAFGLRSMRLPEPDASISAERALDFDAIRLFAERAAEAKRGFDLTDDDVPAAVEICRRLDGMPLAIELAAARVRTFPPAKLAELLDERFRLLTGGSRTALPRQQTLAATIEWSYRLLDEREQALLRRLSTFQGGFTYESAAAVATAEPIDELDLLELLPSIVDKSLVVASEAEEEPRYRMLETIRQFARDLLEDTDEADAVRAAHAEHFARFATEAGDGINSTDEIRWHRRLDSDLDNVRQAMTWAMEHGRGLLALQMAIDLQWYWWLTQRPKEGLEWLARTRAIAGPIDRPTEAAVLYVEAHLLERGTGVDPEPLFNRSVEILRALQREESHPEIVRRYLPDALGGLAIVAGMKGDPERSDALGREALEVALQFGDPVRAAVHQRNLDYNEMEATKDIARYRNEFDQIHHQTRIPRHHRQELIGMACFELDHGDAKLGAEWYERAAEAFDDAHLPFLADLQRSRVHLWLLVDGDTAAAEPLLMWLRRLATRPDLAGGSRSLAELVSDRAGVDAARGDWTRVAEAYGKFDALTTELRPYFPNALWAFHDRTREDATRELGAEAFGRHHEAGARMTYAETVEFLVA